MGEGLSANLNLAMDKAWNILERLLKFFTRLAIVFGKQIINLYVWFFKVWVWPVFLWAIWIFLGLSFGVIVLAIGRNFVQFPGLDWGNVSSLSRTLIGGAVGVAAMFWIRKRWFGRPRSPE